MTLTPSHIIEYMFCPRFTFFEYIICIPQYEEKFYKVLKGRETHSGKLNINKEYLRKRIGVKEKYIDQYLTNNYLRGRIDEVLLLNNGTMAPLDYKFAEYDNTVFRTYKIQSYCYAILIENNFKYEVNKGYLVYVRSNNKLVEIPISTENKKNVLKVIDNIQKIIDNNYFPKATKYKMQCVNCTYKNICIK